MTITGAGWSQCIGIDIYISIHVHVYISTDMYMYRCIYIYIYVYILTHLPAHVFLHACVLTSTQECMYKRHVQQRRAA